MFATLALPLFWLVVVYLGALLALVLQSFYGVDSFTGQVTHQFSLENYRQLLQPANLDIIMRTVIMAALVTLAAVPLAYPLAYYMARYASPRMKMLLYVLILLPLWSSYLVRVYAWKLILAKEGIISWFATQTGTSGAAGCVPANSGRGRHVVGAVELWHLHRVCVRVAALHDHRD